MINFFINTIQLIRYTSCPNPSLERPLFALPPVSPLATRLFLPCRRSFSRGYLLRLADETIFACVTAGAMNKTKFCCRSVGHKKTLWSVVARWHAQHWFLGQGCKWRGICCEGQPKGRIVRLERVNFGPPLRSNVHLERRPRCHEGQHGLDVGRNSSA